MMHLNLFEWQLHILFIVVVVEIITAIMHRQKIAETDVLV